MEEQAQVLEAHDEAMPTGPDGAPEGQGGKARRTRRGHRAKASGKRRERPWLPRVTVALVACTAVLALLCVLQMRDVERGLLSTVARQQDEYVDLVVGQIGLHDEPDDEGIIQDILGVIDSSSGQYWAFSRDDTMLFVRDVAETDKYKGMPSSSYLGEGEAEDFYEGLSQDETTHAYLTIDGRDYVASGRAFEYDGSTYRLCLLTNESTVLDDNEMLGARSRLGALLGIETALLLFCGVWLASHRDGVARELAEARLEVAELDGRVERLDEAIAEARAQDSDRPWGRSGDMPQVMRTYRLKFYLNAQHYIVIDGRKGETHPHTWEFALTIRVTSHEFTPFSAFERRVGDYLAPYQNKVLNEMPPFDTVMPTLENLVEEFARALAPIVSEVGGTLVELEGSEGPTRSYGVSLDGEPEAGSEGEAEPEPQAGPAGRPAGDA